MELMLVKWILLSSLATLSFDKRRSEFFTNELINFIKINRRKTNRL